MRALLLIAAGCVPSAPEPGPTPLPPVPAVLVNEVQTANRSTFGLDGDTPDWVEVVNASDEAVDLARVTLENGANQPFPVGEGMLEPGARWLVLADPSPVAPNGWEGAGQVPFTLDQDGDRLWVRVDGQVTDALAVPALDEDVAWARHPDGGPGSLTAAPTPGAANADRPTDTDDPADELFTSSRVWRLDLVITAEGYQTLNQDIWSGGQRETVPASFLLDGMAFTEVGLRMKGSASAAPMSSKPAFKLDLNEYADHRFRGVKGLNLHNGNVFDPTLVRDHLTYRLARAAGLPAPRVGWVDLYINDVHFGLYVLQEDTDRRFIEARFPGDGDTSLLVEPNVVWFDFGDPSSTPAGLGPGVEVAPLVPDPALQDAVIAADTIAAGAPSAATLTALFEHVDRENLLVYTAWEGFVGHTDGYQVMNNWRFVVLGSDHRLRLVPSGAEWTWEQPPLMPQGGRLMTLCAANTECRRDVAVRMLELADLTESLDLLGDFDRIGHMLDPYIVADPRRIHTLSQVQSSRELTRRTVRRNPDRARARVAAAFPELVP